MRRLLSFLLLLVGCYYETIWAFTTTTPGRAVTPGEKHIVGDIVHALVGENN